MITLLLVAVLGSPIGQSQPMRLTDTKQSSPCHDRTLPPIILIIDGTPGWQGQAATKVLQELRVRLNRFPLQVARFDAEPTLKSSYVVQGTNRDLMTVRPRTPMRDAMETGIAQLIAAPSPRIMIVVAHNESYPASVSIGYLLNLAQRSETEIHAVYLAPSHNRSVVSVRLRWVAGKALWIPEKLGMRERGNSTRDTSRMLMDLANATGGTACVAQDEPSRTTCVSTIATAIARLSRR